MSAAQPALPEGMRIYAVGDIHGRFDLLQGLAGWIRRELAEKPAGEAIEIFLGDAIDRGPQSREVVEWMISEPPLGARRICLLGNHEDLLLNALAEPETLEHWLANGGTATLRSYLAAEVGAVPAMTLAEAYAALTRAIPPSHLGFFGALPRMAAFGDYAFVHAGLRPGRPLTEQDPYDLVWIREPFLSSSYDFGCVVVHGHTPAEQPEVRPNRINLDTGAVFTGRLTCLVLEGATRRFIQISSS